MLPTNFEGDTYKICSNITTNFGDNNILKEKEKTRKYNFSNPIEEKYISTGWSKDDESDMQDKETYSNESENITEDSGLIMAKAMVKTMSKNPIFAQKIKELKEKYNLDDNGDEIKNLAPPA